MTHFIWSDGRRTSSQAIFECLKHILRGPNVILEQPIYPIKILENGSGIGLKYKLIRRTSKNINSGYKMSNERVVSPRYPDLPFCQKVLDNCISICISNFPSFYIKKAYGWYMLA